MNSKAKQTLLKKYLTNLGLKEIDSVSTNSVYFTNHKIAIKLSDHVMGTKEKELAIICGSVNNPDIYLLFTYGQVLTLNSLKEVKRTIEDFILFSTLDIRTNKEGASEIIKRLTNAVEKYRKYKEMIDSLTPKQIKVLKMWANGKNK